MLVEPFLTSSSNSSPSRRALPSLFCPENSRAFRSLCRLYKKTTPNAIRIRAMEPVIAPAIAAIRREVALAEGGLTSVAGRDEDIVICKTSPVKKEDLNEQYEKKTYSSRRATNDGNNCCYN